MISTGLIASHSDKLIVDVWEQGDITTKKPDRARMRISRSPVSNKLQSLRKKNADQ